MKKSKNLQFGKFQKCSKYSIFEKNQIFLICQFRKITNLKNTIWKTINIPWIYNFTNYHIFWMFEKLKQISKWKINSKIEKSNNSSFVLLVFEISKFRNIGFLTQNIWHFTKLEIFGILIVLEIVKFGKFSIFRNWKILELWLFYEFFNLENFHYIASKLILIKGQNSKNLEFEKFEKLKIEKTSIICTYFRHYYYRKWIFLMSLIWLIF